MLNVLFVVVIDHQLNSDHSSLLLDWSKTHSSPKYFCRTWWRRFWISFANRCIKMAINFLNNVIKFNPSHWYLDSLTYMLQTSFISWAFWGISVFPRSPHSRIITHLLKLKNKRKVRKIQKYLKLFLSSSGWHENLKATSEEKIKIFKISRVGKTEKKTLGIYSQKALIK